MKTAMDATRLVEDLLTQVGARVDAVSPAKAASNIVEPPTSHVSGKVDDQTTTPNEGPESKSDKAELSNVFGGLKVTPSNDATDQPDPPPLGLDKKPTGDDPANETASASGNHVLDPKTTSPAKADGKSAFAYDARKPLVENAAVNKAHGEHLLAKLAAAMSPAGDAPAAPAAVAPRAAGDPVAETALQLCKAAGWDLAAQTGGFDARAVAELVRGDAYGIVKEAFHAADAVADCYDGVLAGEAERRSKSAGKAAGDEDGDDDGPPAKKEKSDAKPAGGSPPPQASAPQAPPAPPGPPGGGMGGDPGAGGAGGGDGQLDQLITQLASLLGMSPDDLATAIASSATSGHGGGGGMAGGPAGGMAGGAGGMGGGMGGGGMGGMEVAAAARPTAPAAKSKFNVPAEVQKRARAVLAEMMRQPTA